MFSSVQFGWGIVTHVPHVQPANTVCGSAVWATIAHILGSILPKELTFVSLKQGLGSSGLLLYQFYYLFKKKTPPFLIIEYSFFLACLGLGIL
jgi:hypothetical protein